jgi:ABC-type transport system involved in cytochrome c biogenesis permease subunit
MNPFTQEAIVHWTAVALYISATAVFGYALIFAQPNKLRPAFWLTSAGLAVHTAGLVLRYFHVGHGPYMLKYEVLSSNAWIAIAMLLWFVWRHPKWSSLALIALPASILMMGVGLFASPEARDLPPTLRSIWLVFHVIFNKLAVGAFILALASAVALLRKQRGTSGRWLDRLPEPNALEVYTIRFVGFGFVFWTTTIGAGAIWANQSWGRYWGWDPIETWSLVTWLALASLLHARIFFRPRPTVVAWSTIGCFGLSVLTVLIFPFVFPSMHSAYFQ